MEESGKPNEFKTTASSQPWVSRVYIVDDHRFFTFALASLVAHHEHLVRCIALHGRHSGIHSLRQAAGRSLLGTRPPSEVRAVAQLLRPMAAFDLRSDPVFQP